MIWQPVNCGHRPCSSSFAEPSADHRTRTRHSASAPHAQRCYRPSCPRRDGRRRLRARLEVDPRDEETLFFLGKLDLNYVWLQLGTLGRKTGWDEYWEARRSLDTVLKQHPQHVRAKVARAWIDYIVDTKMPRGTRWLLGGGNKKRGLRAVREAATVDADLFVRAEAGFALWDMQVRERNIAEARATAATLAQDFPDNPELR